MEAYPLAALLTVRRYREESAKRRVRGAEIAVREAEENVEKKQRELDEFRVWRRQEEDRRYEAIMNVPLSLEKLEMFKAGLARLADEEHAREQAVLSARKEVEQRRVELEGAKAAAKTASKNTSKIEAHRDLWKEDAKKEEERREDLELEEFHPLSRKGAEAEGEDA